MPIDRMEARAARRTMAEQAQDMFREELRGRQLSNTALEAETMRAGEKHGEEMRTSALGRRNIMRGAPIDRAGKQAEIDDLYAGRQQAEQAARVGELAGEKQHWMAQDEATLERDRFGLDERKQGEVERRNLAGEAFDRFKAAQIDPNVIMSALSALGDPDISDQQKAQIAQGMSVLLRRANAQQGGGVPSGAPGPRPGGGGGGGGGGELLNLFGRATGANQTQMQMRDRLQAILPELQRAMKQPERAREVRALLEQHLPGATPEQVRKAMSQLMTGEAGEAYGQAMEPEPGSGFVYGAAQSLSHLLQPSRAIDYEKRQQGARDELLNVLGGGGGPTITPRDQRAPPIFPGTIEEETAMSQGERLGARAEKVRSPFAGLADVVPAIGRAFADTFTGREEPEPLTAPERATGPQRSPGYEDWKTELMQRALQRSDQISPAREAPGQPAIAPPEDMIQPSPPPKLAAYQLRQIKAARNRKDRETVLAKYGVPQKFWIYFGPDMDVSDPTVNADVAR